MEESAPNIYVSYSRKNRQSMQNLCQALEQRGFKVWRMKLG